MKKSEWVCVIYISKRVMDNEIIERAKMGDREAQKQIYIAYKDKIYTFCIFHNCNFDDAEDLTQDIFLKIFRGIRRFKKGNFNGWIYKIAINHIFNSVSRRKSFLKQIEENFALEDRNIEESINIEKALSKMPERLSLLLILKEKEGLNYRELSKVFGVPIGTIASRLAKARTLFRKYYGGKNVQR